MSRCKQEIQFTGSSSMGTYRRRFFGSCLTGVLAGMLVLSGGSIQAEESEFAGLIRTKSPDRPSYQAPKVARTSSAPTFDDDSLTVEDVVEMDTNVLEERDEYSPPVILRQTAKQVSYETSEPSRGNSQVAYHPRLVRSGIGHRIAEQSCGAEATCGMEPVCGCEESGFACDGSCMSCDGGCDSLCGGCDACSGGGQSCGGQNCGGCCECNLRLSMDPCQWFGSVELLMMWRVGDGLPPLVTTSTNATGSGVIGAAGTRVLFGGERVLDELTAGGRVTVGTWLDEQHCRSLVFRGWGAEQASYDFATSQNINAIIARPFRNVTDGQTAGNQSQVIAAPTQRTGSINVNGNSDVYGGDVSLRQSWLGGLGGYVDFLYGYQYMRVDESLAIGSSSTVLANQPIPVGTILDVQDRFDAENEFHGGQLGLAARYREGCWSFNGTIKAAAGALKRSANLRGTTVTSLGNQIATDPNGLLVRSTNRGQKNDSTFGWVPELDATLGWRWTRNLDLSFGYHAIAMTDALQVSGMIDPQLAVNAAANPTGLQRPSAALRYDTFYIHGIHFGVQYLY